MYQRRRARLVLVVLIIAALVFVTIDFRTGGDGDGPLDRVRNVVTSVLRPVQDGLTTVVRPVGDAASSVTDLFAVRAENRRLQARVESLAEQHRSFTDLERENEELRDLLGVRERSGLEVVAGRAVALGPSHFEYTITIDVGSDDGVERDMPVISSDGLVGRVFQVTPTASRVLLAIDPNFAAATRIARDGESGMLHGRGSEPMLFNPEDPEAEVEVGDEVVTSAYDGGIFPGGIPVGAVAEVGETSTRLTRDVQVRPYVNFTRLHHVMVVLTTPVEEIPPLDEADDAVFDPPELDEPIQGPEDGPPDADGGGAEGD